MDEPVASCWDNSSDFPSEFPSTTGSDPKLDFMKHFKPNVILSGEDVYTQSKRIEKTIPSKGGHKDFEPDGTWLLGKKMDMFYSTMENLLEEPRTEKLGSLLIGSWDPVKNLVEYKRDARKFWAKMGFVDEKRKWLHPEEALYLMEINCMEVYNGDVPLSLQQAYRIFIGTSTDRNRYQVYAHLRRLGYAVIRHQGRSDMTKYERNLKLNQYVKDGHNKKRKIPKNLSANKSSEPEKDKNNSGSASTQENLSKRLKIENSSEIQETNHDDSKSLPMAVNCSNNSGRTEDITDTSGNQDNENNSNCRNANIECKPVPEVLGQISQDTSKTSSLEEEKSAKTEFEVISKNANCDSSTPESEENSVSLCNLNKNSNSHSSETDISQKSQRCNSWFERPDNDSTENSDSTDNSGRLSPNFLSDIKKLRVLNDDESETPCKMFMYPKWNFEEYNLPNFASMFRLRCSHPTDSVAIPLFGEALPEGTLDFDIQEYRETVMSLHKYHRQSRGRTEVLEFSSQNKFHNQKKTAKNWAEYKKISELEKQDKSSISPLQFLWEGEVTPLVAPEDATSTGAILKKLQIVKHAQLHVCSMTDRLPDHPEKWTIVFDVYQPNSNFKKTDPGLPYFRVCVCGVDEDPPTVSDVLHFSGYFADDVPMNWAVVDNGEISFYVFRGVNIPERP